MSYVVTKQEKYIVSSAFLRLICKDVESAKYLEIILSLKAYRDIVHMKSRGSVIKNLDLKDLLYIPIPFPNQEKRDKIVREVDEIKAKVKRLKREATNDWAQAKEEVKKIVFKNQK